MAIDPTADILAPDAYILGSRAAVSPPFGGPKDPHNGCPGGHRYMRRAGVAADIYRRRTGQLVKSFERRLGGYEPAGPTAFDRTLRQFDFLGAGRDDRYQSVLVPQSVRKPAIIFCPPQLCHPPAGRVQDRKSVTGLGCDPGRLIAVLLRGRYRKLIPQLRVQDIQSGADKLKILIDHIQAAGHDYSLSKQKAAQRLAKFTLAETDPSRRSRQTRDQCRLEKALKIDRGRVTAFAETSRLDLKLRVHCLWRTCFADRRSIDFDKTVDHRIVPKDLGRSAFYHPIDLDIGKRPANGGKCRQSVNQIADRTELYKKDPHVNLMLPKIVEFRSMPIINQR